MGFRLICSLVVLIHVLMFAAVSRIANDIDSIVAPREGQGLIGFSVATQPFYSDASNIVEWVISEFSHADFNHLLGNMLYTIVGMALIGRYGTRPTAALILSMVGTIGLGYLIISGSGLYFIGFSLIANAIFALGAVLCLRSNFGVGASLLLLGVAPDIINIYNPTGLIHCVGIFVGLILGLTFLRK